MYRRFDSRTSSARFTTGQEAEAADFCRRPPSTASFRVYTQHNILWAMRWLPGVVVGGTIFLNWVDPPPEGNLSLQIQLWAISAAMVFVIVGLGFYQLRKLGPLTIDPRSATLTYRRQPIPFSQLGLTRIDSAAAFMPSVGPALEGGGPGSRIALDVVVSGAFMLSPDDQAPKRKVERIANRLNDALAEYFEREETRAWLKARGFDVDGATQKGASL